jgi:hypothetical protein
LFYVNAQGLKSEITDRSATIHHYPYFNLPSMECHIALPYAAINAGPKLASANLEDVVEKCGGSDVYREDLMECLVLLREIWELFEQAKDDAERWEKSNRQPTKREREKDDMERLSYMGRHTTRSKSQSSRHQPSPTPKRNNNDPTTSQSIIQLKACLTKHALFRHGKHQKLQNSPFRGIRSWLEGTQLDRF